MEEAQQNRQAFLADVEAHKALSGDISRAIEGQNAGLENIASKLSSALKGDRVNMDSIDPSDFRQLSTFIDLFNAALVDLSVAATQMLVLLLQKDHRARKDIKGFVGGLVEAYATGGQERLLPRPAATVDRRSQPYRDFANAVRRLTRGSE